MTKLEKFSIILCCFFGLVWVIALILAYIEKPLLLFCFPTCAICYLINIHLNKEYFDIEVFLITTFVGGIIATILIAGI